MAITPGGRVGDASPLGKKGPRRLDDYVREVAHALMRRGFGKSHAIATAKNSLKRWRRGGGKVRPQVRAGAAAHLGLQQALDRSHGKSMSAAVDQAAHELLDLAWSEAMHPRNKGRFASKGNSRTKVRPPKENKPHHRQARAARLAQEEMARRYIAKSGLHRGQLGAARRGIVDHSESKGSRPTGLIFSGGLRSQFSNPQTAIEIDLAWDEALHPRGRGGKWVGKGGGVIESRLGKAAQELDRRHAQHYDHVDTVMQAHQHLSTHLTHVDAKGVYSPERRKQQENLIRSVHRRMSKTAKVERQSLFLGGLPGAGKSYTLNRSGLLDASHFVVANPDIFKEEMAKRGMIPDVSGHPELAPMERAQLVHEEASAMAKRLANRSARRGQNVAWDITMASPGSVHDRLNHLEKHGYQHKSVFVDVPTSLSYQRVRDRHRSEWERHLAGKGVGGRPVPQSYIDSFNTTSPFNSKNRDTFESLKGRFGAYRVFNEHGQVVSSKGRF